MEFLLKNRNMFHTRPSKSPEFKSLALRKILPYKTMVFNIQGNYHRIILVYSHNIEIITEELLIS